MTMTLDELNALDRAGFVAALGPVFEHAPWVAETAWTKRPFADADALHAAMLAEVSNADEDRQLTFIRGHPDLANRLQMAEGLTRESQAEQASAGLDQLTPDEYARFNALNSDYTTRFAFPFIIAVRDNTRASILAAFEQRLANDADAERAEALRQIARITRLRLDAVLTA